MENLDINKKPSKDDNDEPIQLDVTDDDIETTKISHAPLSLGGNSSSNSTVQTSKAPLQPAISRPPGKPVDSTERITGMKTFYTKLHAGAIDFMEEQIKGWLEKNPGIVIKRTNVVVGEVIAKKTEPNLVITVWY